MPPVVGIFVGVLLGLAVDGRSSPGGHSEWHRNRIFWRPLLRGYSHILLEYIDPWKGQLCGQQQCRRIHWRMACHPHTVWL